MLSKPLFAAYGLCTIMILIDGVDFMPFGKTQNVVTAILKTL